MNMDEIVNYPIEFFNSLDIPGIPQHILSLKIGMPIIPVRNINPTRMCNGTWLAVKKMMLKVIEASILNGKSKGDVIPTDMPFKFKRLQFHVRLAFSMTTNKAQGQSLQVCRLNLKNHDLHMENYMFSFSRVGNHKKLFIFPQYGKTKKNIVCTKALQ